MQSARYKNNNLITESRRNKTALRPINALITINLPHEDIMLNIIIVHRIRALAITI
jgi:hypothetical protein